MEALFFQPKGTVIYSGDRWIIVCEINVMEHYTNLHRIHEEVVRIKSAIDQMGAFGREIVSGGELDSLITSSGELSQLILSLRRVTPHELRKKRGLFNVVGNVEKYLFGVMDNDDYELVTNALREIKHNQSEIIHLMKNHISITKTLDRKIGNYAEAMSKLSATVITEFQKISRVVTALEGRVLNLTKEIRDFERVSTLLRALELGISRSAFQLYRLQESLGQASRGRLSVNLLSPTDLSELLKRIMVALPEGVSLLTSTSIRQMYYYYQIAEVTAVSTAETLRLIVTIPLKRQNREFILFSVHEAPRRVLDSAYFITTRREARYFLASIDRKFYAMMDETELSLCRRAQVWVCPATSPVYARRRVTCTSSFFFEGPQAAQQQCPFVIKLIEPLPFWIRDSEREVWSYSSLAKTRVTFKCQDSNRVTVREDWIEGDGTLNQTHCEIEGDEFKLFAETRGISQVQLRLYEPAVPRLNLTTLGIITDGYSAEVVQQTLDELVKVTKNQSPGVQEIPLEQLRDQLSALTTGRVKRLSMQVGIPTSVLVSLGLAGLGWLVWKRRNVRTQRSVAAPTEREEPPISWENVSEHD